jgi:hypothetical protein
VFRASDAALTLQKWDRFVEATTDSGDNNLNSEQSAEAYEHSTALLIDCVYTDNVYGGGASEKYRCANRFEKIEFRTRMLRPSSIKKCNTNNGELNGHQGSQEIEQKLENRPTLSLP